MPGARVGERIWRARKHHTWIDAQIHPTDDSRFVLQFFYDGSLILRRSWTCRADAVAFADQQLRELQRAGWNSHW